ncbi:MAG: hypothetical protein FWH27_12095 [Planctomycetaceae bacterium]|nr:hypothetical protein [Planctomycetaceae bacterium]
MRCFWASDTLSGSPACTTRDLRKNSGTSRRNVFRWCVASVSMGISSVTPGDYNGVSRLSQLLERPLDGRSISIMS